MGRPIEIFHAMDPDQAGASRVSYAIDRLSDRRRHFTINVNGTILLQRPLDRERQQQHVVSGSTRPLMWGVMDVLRPLWVGNIKQSGE